MAYLNMSTTHVYVAMPSNYIMWVISLLNMWGNKYNVKIK